MSTLYDQVAALDKGVADRWKAQTHDDPKHKLTAADVDAIVSPLLKAVKTSKDRVFISQKQAEAIVTLVQTTSFGKGGLDRLRFWVRFAEDSIALDLRPLINPDELSPITHALAVGSSFSFTSPGTKLSYAPHDYLAIGELIRQKKIEVFRAEISDLWKLTKDDGEYRSDFNMLIVYLKTNDDAFTGTVVHEATHAIQDWRDITAQRRFIEADAYISAAATLDKSLFVDDMSKAAFAASRFVLDRKAVLGNKDWQKAYDNVVGTYESLNTDGRTIVAETAKGETESAQYKNILDAVDQALAFGDWVANTAKDAVAGLAAGVSQTLP